MTGSSPNLKCITLKCLYYICTICTLNKTFVPLKVKELCQDVPGLAALTLKVAGPSGSASQRQIPDLNMDKNLLEGLLGSIRDAVSTKYRHDDVALPLFDPDKSQNGAESWCKNIEAISKEFDWSSIQTAAKAGPCLINIRKKITPRYTQEDITNAVREVKNALL